MTALALQANRSRRLWTRHTSSRRRADPRNHEYEYQPEESKARSGIDDALERMAKAAGQAAGKEVAKSLRLRVQVLAAIVAGVVGTLTAKAADLTLIGWHGILHDILVGFDWIAATAGGLIPRLFH